MNDVRLLAKVEELKRQHELTAHLLVCSLYKRHDHVPLAYAPSFVPRERIFSSESPAVVAVEQPQFVFSHNVSSPERLLPATPDLCFAQAALLKLPFEEASARRGIGREEQETLTEMSIKWLSLAKKR
jgi:hypothetical protein